MTQKTHRHAPVLLWGLGLPCLMVLGPIPFLYGASFRLLGVPVCVIWLFICMPLTSLCLFIASRLTDESA